MEQFGYEKLDVYRCSMEFLETAFELIEKLPRGYGHLASQLQRAALSVPLNIAEGSGKSSFPERKRFFEIARCSALECSAIIQCALVLRLADNTLLQHNRTLIFRIVQMLSKLAKNNR